MGIIVPPVWFNEESFRHSDLLSDNISEKTLEFEISKEDVDELTEILYNLSDDQSRCITVFRDVVIINGDIYDICLSCGDIVIDGKWQSLSNEQRVKLKELKLKITGIS